MVKNCRVTLATIVAAAGLFAGGFVVDETQSPQYRVNHVANHSILAPEGQSTHEGMCIDS